MFDASHPVKWTLERAYYLNCREKTPVETDLVGVSGSNFVLSPSGDMIVFNHEIPVDMYSPMHFNLKIWLDLDDDNELDTNEQEYVNDIEFVQYPPIYIIPDKSTQYSVFVNGHNRTSSEIIINNKYNLGVAPGSSDSGDHMYVISVSSFNESDEFTYKYNGTMCRYDYMIGDPRVNESYTNLNSDGYNMQNAWREAKDVNGASRKLTYYYPTSTDASASRMIAPKFRIVSFYSSGNSVITPEGAKMRCASYQEDGFPAGRWRLPTTAEVAYVIKLQVEKKIQDIFYKGNNYYSSTSLVQYNPDAANEEDRVVVKDQSGTGSVRCVYDEWYWGSEREAVKNNNYGGGYEFTWGDEPR